MRHLLHPALSIGGCAALALSVCAPALAAQSIHEAVRVANRARLSAARLPEPGEYNVLLVVLDDLGTDKLKVYAEDAGPPGFCSSAQLDSVPTPGLDALAAEGLLFTRAYVNPTCSPTRAALLTGRYGRRTGIGHAINPGEDPGYALPAGEVCLAELIRDLNATAYRRAAFGKWHLTSYEGDECHPANAGFERFEGLMANPESHFEWEKVTSLGGSLAGCTSTLTQDIPPVPGATPSEDNWNAGVARADAAAWINSLADTERFFAYVCFSPPHAPQEVPPYSSLSRRTQARLSFQGLDAGDGPRVGQPADKQLIYHAMVEGQDKQLQKLLAAVTPAVLARTMVFVIGDNGTPGDMISDPALVGHGKRTLFELGTRVPLVVTGPLVAAHAGTACRALLDGVDLWRTIANVTGISNTAIDTAMTGTTVDSLSFLARLQLPGGTGPRTYSYSEAFPNGTPPPLLLAYRRGIHDGTFRYMRYYDDFGNLTEKLFHTAADPCELVDLMVPPHVLTPAEQAALDALRAAMDAL